MSELSNESRALIRRVGTADGPGPLDRARVKRRIVASLVGAGAALGGGGTVASGAPAGALAAATAGKVTVASVALWLAAGAGLGAVVSSPALVAAYRRGEAARVSAPPPAVATVREKATAHAAESPAAKPRTGVAETPASEAAAERSVADRSRPAPSSGAASLAEETRLLHAAQRELARKQTGAALALLDEHARRFPKGALAEERSAARVLALCDLGRVAEARGAAESFVRAAPQSPLVPRLRGSCALSKASSGSGE